MSDLAGDTSISCTLQSPDLLHVGVHNHCIACLRWSVNQVCPCMQVRQLQSIGFTVSKDILAEVDTANKFYRHGLLMKQVVNFYNNSATEMIPCQKPMLLQVSPLQMHAVHRPILIHHTWLHTVLSLLYLRFIVSMQVMLL